MKNKFQNIIVLLVLFFSVNLGSKLFAQDNATLSIEQQVRNKQFTFLTSSVSPLRGATKFLNDSYYVRVSGDSLVSDLPYFGVAQSAPISSDDAGIKFTSTNFSYHTEARKKDSWDIQVDFKDQTTTRQFHFIVYDNGTATLDVTSNFRDPISFKGYLKK